MPSSLTPRANILHWRAEDEASSIEKLRDNVARAAYNNWPSEAGFDNLTEERGPVELKVTGNIPPWSSGCLYRTGPGGCKVNDTKSGTFHISHWFDGLAHAHRFDMIASPESLDDEPGQGTSTPSKSVRVFYSSRRQAEAVEKEVRLSGTLRAVTFGQRQNPGVGVLSKFMGIFQRPKRLDNIGVTVHANAAALNSVSRRSLQSPNRPKGRGHQPLPQTVFLGTDMAWMAEVDPKTMNVIDYVHQEKLHPKLKGPMGPAHAQTDPLTGEHLSFNLDFGSKGATYRVFQVNANSGATTILATFQAAPAYIHSFFLTPNYVVVCVPVAHYQQQGAIILWKGSLLEALSPFDSSEKCKWIVVDRRHGKGVVAEMATPAGFFIHTVNAFEDDEGDIVCDMIDFPNSDVLFGLYYDILLNRNGQAEAFRKGGDKRERTVDPRLTRYRLCLGNKPSAPTPSITLDLQIPAPHIGDLPTINPAYACRRHRFVYSLVNRGLSTLFDAIGKTDTETRDVLLWTGPAGHTPGEAIFVARPTEKGQESEGKDEDEGVLLSVVLDGHNRTSYLLCLDAKTMRELGRAECGFAVGFGFHGQHVRS